MCQSKEREGRIPEEMCQKKGREGTRRDKLYRSICREALQLYLERQL